MFSRVFHFSAKISFRYLSSNSKLLSNFSLPTFTGEKMSAKEGLSPLDPSSFSRPELAIVTNIGLNLNVDFEKKILSGNVQLAVKKVDQTVNEVILDILKLNVHSVYDASNKQPLNYNIADPIGEYGSKMVVDLPKSSSDNYTIGIEYETSPDATGLQWLEPSQTAGKKYPFLFSQFQPTHARSVLPCQDSPAVKTKYTAAITAPQGFTVLMSAIRDETKQLQNGTLYHFVQDVPLSSYLIAIAVGVLDSRRLGPRSHVWAEKEIIEECANEFSETEHQLKTAEEICGPYVWGIYDLLVLPPSFPYGGMENPCLTFVTPTLLAGDKSLANVVAHEIAHSWTGNLVTNRNFEHFWLNEGFTVFVERKIKGKLESPESQDFDAYAHVSELNETINLLGKTSPLTQLVIDLKGVHPDDAFSTVPYEKGQTFLRYLETTVWGPAQFEPFLRTYFDAYKYKALDTDEFKKFFLNYFKDNKKISEIDWDLWLKTPGMPPIIPNYNKALAVEVEKLVEKFVNWNGDSLIPITAEEKNKLTSSQVIYFLEKISKSEAQAISKLQALNDLFHFDTVKNCEIKFRWLRTCLKARWEEKVEPVLQWVNEVGRMKYVRPLYRDLYGWEEVRNKTVKNFKSNRQNMMHVSAYTLEKDLHISAK